MKSKQNRVMRTVVILLAMVALIFGLFVSQYMHRSAQLDQAQFHGTWLDKSREVSAIELMGTNGPFNNASLEHHWTMMFFGFTTCPTICPTTMAELAKMMGILEKQGVTPLPQVVLVSLDPERDSVDKLQHYVTAFNPHFLGARGANEAVVKSLAEEMGVAYTKIQAPDVANHQTYNIEHTGTVMLFNPKGQLQAFFTMPHQAALLAEDYRLAVGLSG
jgi:protein SCO1/2